MKFPGIAAVILVVLCLQGAIQAQTVEITTLTPDATFGPGDSITFSATVRWNTPGNTGSKSLDLIVRETLADNKTRDVTAGSVGVTGTNGTNTVTNPATPYLFPRLLCSTGSCASAPTLQGRLTPRVTKLEVFARIRSGSTTLADSALRAQQIAYPEVASVTPGTQTLMTEQTVRVNTTGTKFSRASTISVAFSSTSNYDLRFSTTYISGQAVSAQLCQPLPRGPNVSNGCGFTVVGDTALEFKIRLMPQELSGTETTDAQLAKWLTSFDIYISWQEANPVAGVQRLPDAARTGVLTPTTPLKADEISLERVELTVNGAAREIVRGGVFTAPPGARIQTTRAAFRQRLTRRAMADVWLVARTTTGAPPPVTDPAFPSWRNSDTIWNLNLSSLSDQLTFTNPLFFNMPADGTGVEFYMVMTAVGASGPADRVYATSETIGSAVAKSTIELSELKVNGEPLALGTIPKGTGRIEGKIRYELGGDASGSVSVTLRAGGANLLASGSLSSFSISGSALSGTRDFKINFDTTDKNGGDFVQLEAVLQDSKSQDAATAKTPLLVRALPVRLFIKNPGATSEIAVLAFPNLYGGKALDGVGSGNYTPILKTTIERNERAVSIALLRKPKDQDADLLGVFVPPPGKLGEASLELPSVPVSQDDDYWELWLVLFDQAADARYYTDKQKIEINTIQVNRLSPCCTVGRNQTREYEYDIRVNAPGSEKYSLRVAALSSEKFFENRTLTEGQGPRSGTVTGKFSIPMGGAVPAFVFLLDRDSAGTRVVKYFLWAPEIMTISSSGGQLAAGPDSRVLTQSNATPRRIEANSNGEDLGGFLVDSETKELTVFKASATSNAPLEATADLARDILGISRTWDFSPPIPEDGSFSADLTLTYSDADLPDDPNFDESKLRIFSYNPKTGDLKSLETRLDTDGNFATARVNSLERVYTLAIPGPFQKATFNFPIMGSTSNLFTGLAMVNTASASAEVKMSVYNSDGERSAAATEPIANTVLGPGQQFPRLAPELFKFNNGVRDGWIQAYASRSSVTGFELLGNDDILDGIAVPSISYAGVVISGVEKDKDLQTEIHLVNPTPFGNNVTLELWTAAGAMSGTRTVALGPRSKFSGLVGTVFSQQIGSGTFNGYIIVRATQAVSVAALNKSPLALAALPGQRLRSGVAQPSQLYSAQLASGPALYTRIDLVNPTRLDANLVLKAVGETGADLASPVAITLKAGQQYIKTAAEIFGFQLSETKVGSVVVESSITGILGDVTFGDSLTSPNFKASLPLDNEPSTQAIYSHVANGGGFYTGLAGFNPNPNAAAVTIKVYKTDGTLTGTGRLNLPAKGRFSKLLPELVPVSAGQLGGYFVVESNQPISSFALFGTSSFSALSAIPAQHVQ